MAPKEIRLVEVQKHNKPKDLWIIIGNKVYDVTKFRHEHPGGEEVLDEVAGKDGTKEFKDAGHSREARTMMEKYFIGNLAEADQKNNVRCRDIGIAVGAVILGITVVYLIKRFAFSRN